MLENNYIEKVINKKINIEGIKMNINNNDKNTIINFIKNEYNINISDIEDLINLNLLYSKNDVINYFINCHGVKARSINIKDFLNRDIIINDLINDKTFIRINDNLFFYNSRFKVIYKIKFKEIK